MFERAVAAGIDRGMVVFLACVGGWKYMSKSEPPEPAHVAFDRLHQLEAFS